MRAISTLPKAFAVGIPLALLALGCEAPTSVQPESSGNNWQSVPDLDSPNGGYTLSDEKPGFGDPALLRLEQSEKPVATTDADSARTDSTFALRIMWGSMQENTTAQPELDWSGKLTLSRGGMRVKSLIAFERPGDRLLEPRPDRRTLGFVSHTRKDVDGMLLLIRDEAGAPPTTLTFASGPYTHTWSLDSLRTASFVVRVDDRGNAVAITSSFRSPTTCPSGFARGTWVQISDSTATEHGVRGMFRGLWQGADSRAAGYVEGRFGVNDHGEKVWFAKIIAPGGRGLALMHGTWAPNASGENPGGIFRGEIDKSAGMPKGVFEGHYLLQKTTERGAAIGFFEARWHGDC